MLDVAEEILNRCTKLNPEDDIEDNNHYRVAFKYEFIEDVRTHPQLAGNEEERAVHYNPGATLGDDRK